MNILKLLFISIIFLSCKSTVNSNSTDAIEEKIPESREPIVFEVIKIRSGPSIETYWPDTMPKFIFCKDSGISNTRASQGISYWKRLGYPIESVRYNVDTLECHGRPDNGTVVIRLIDDTIPINQNLSVTQVYYRRDNKQILGAVIYLIGGYANKPRLIEHEIGHALGWSHNNSYLHVMNSEYDKTGYDGSGLRYLRYLSLILEI